MAERDAKDTAAETYDAASDAFDHPALTFWDAAGRGTVGLLALTRGMTVLDVAAGSGASALPAAEAVGASGRVVAVDLSERLLELAAAKAAARGLDWFETRVADMEQLEDEDGSYDVAICVFGIFFLPDMVRGVRELWRLVRPGGKLAITTWDRGIFEPLYEPFWESIAAVRPELADNRYNPWDSIVDREPLSDLFQSAGATAPDISAGSHPTAISGPADWWAVVMGTGLRGTVLRLTPAETQQVRRANDEAVASRAPLHIRADVHYAIATKPI